MEIQVSEHIRLMPFLWIEVDDEPGPDSQRSYIESHSIALLSNYNLHSTDTIDPPSPDWLGGHAWNEKVRKSGLWNSDYVDELYDENFLKVLREFISAI